MLPSDADDDDGPEPRSWLRRRPWVIGSGVAAVALVIVAALALTRDEEPEKAAPTTTTTAAPTTTEAPTTTTTASPFPLCVAPPPPTGPPGPLTGQPVQAPGAELRPALIVKIDNYDPDARPQGGLSRADVVFEEKVEGGLSRFAAVFQSTSASVGPVRSARSTDISIAAMFGRPLFAYSGANGSFQAMVNDAPLIDVGGGARGGAYHREPGRAAPHNFFTTTDALWAGIDPVPPQPLWAFRPADSPLPGAQPVTEATYHFGSGFLLARWVWDPALGAFLRHQNGSLHIDADFCPVAVQNLIIQLVDYVDSGVDDAVGGAIPEAAMVGTGSAWVLSGGGAVAGTWERPAPEAPTRFLGPDGAPLALAPGRTWVALVPASVGAQVS